MSLEILHKNSILSANPEEIGGMVASCIQDYSLTRLCLEYEREDNVEAQTASFKIWLAGTDGKGQPYTLLQLQEFPGNFPSFLAQVKEAAEKMSISFENRLEQDGYTIGCHSIRRRIERER